MIAASLGANIFYSRLTGHGRTADAMREASVSAWIQDLAEAFEIGTMIGDRVIILSCSTGGTLVATGIANGVFSEKLFSTVFFAPNFGVQDQMAELLTWPLALYWAPFIGGEMQINDAAEPVTCSLLDNILSNNIAYPDDATDRHG